jgi:hypothetical protein
MDELRETDPPAPLFLHVPVRRLIILSFFTLSLYDAYWLYRNWRYVRDREGSSIWPFWRGIFGIFFCTVLFRRIHDNEEARSVQLQTFPPGWLSTGWVFLIFLSIGLCNLPGKTGLLGLIVPTSLGLVPVQMYVNAVESKRRPGQPYYRWSAGHVVCLVLGVIGWLLILLGLTLEPPN